MEFLRTVVAKVFIFILFGLLIASFAVWGIGDIFRGTTGPQTVAEVGEYEITGLAYSRELSQDFNRIQRNIGGSFTMEQAEQLGLPQQVLQRMVGDGLFSAEARDLNMTVSDDAVREEIISQEAFQDDFGRFSKDRFQRVLAANRLSEEAFVADLREELLRGQIVDATVSPIAAPALLAETVYRYRAEARIVDYLSVDYASMTVEEEPSEEELQAIHEEFSGRFMAPETRDLKILSIDPEMMAAQFQVDDAELRSVYDERAEELSVPETRSLTQFVTEDEDQANQILGRISAGEGFASAVQSVADGSLVELGDLTRGELSVTLPESVDKVFSAESGEIVGPVESIYGFHLVQITDIAPGSTPSFEEVKDELRDDVIMERAVDEMISLANRADDLLAAGATIEEVADQLNLSLASVERIDAEGNVAGGPASNPLLTSSRVLQVAFETAEGDQSLLTENDDGGYFLVEVQRVHAPAVRPLDDVREQVAEVWRAQERESQALAQAQDYVDRINGSNVTLSGIAEGAGYEVNRGVRITRVEPGALSSVADALFTEDEGRALLGQAENRALVVVLTGAESANPGANDQAVARLANNLEGQLKSDLLGLYGNALQEKFGVTVNQALLDQIINETF